MQNFDGKVAVVTGAANGLGRALAKHCAKKGMKTVLADIQEESLVKLEKDLKQQGAEVISVVTDVSKQEDIVILAEKTSKAFGGVHLLFNNAGVSVGRLASLWETTIPDWQWCMNVNLWSAIYGIHTFVPMMIEQNSECHIVNTSSVAGFLSSTLRATYNVTKNGILILSETLSMELKEKGHEHIGVSVLCPGFVNTNIINSETYRPKDLKNKPEEEVVSDDLKKKAEMRCLAVTMGMPAEEAADITFDAIKNNEFYIFTHPKIKDLIDERNNNIINNKHPQKPAYSRDMYPEELRGKV